MCYKGIVKNGVVVLEGGVALPEDTEVSVEPVAQSEREQPIPWSEVFGDIIGSVDDMPPDMAENHDHYIHGTTKR